MPCRICTTNDREALIEELAIGMWAKCEVRHLPSDWCEEWEKAGSYWQHIFRQYAAVFIDVAHRDHMHDG